MIDENVLDDIVNERIDFRGGRGKQSGHFEECALHELLGEDTMPCPFCGCDDVFLWNTHSPSYCIECNECGCEYHGVYDDSWDKAPYKQRHKEAIRQVVDAWQSRA